MCLGTTQHEHLNPIPAQCICSRHFVLKCKAAGGKAVAFPSSENLCIFNLYVTCMLLLLTIRAFKSAQVWSLLYFLSRF